MNPILLVAVAFSPFLTACLYGRLDDRRARRAEWGLIEDRARANAALAHRDGRVLLASGRESPAAEGTASREAAGAFSAGAR